MNYLFIHGGIVLSLIQILDAFVLARNNGKCGLPQRTFAFIEYTWAGVSMWIVRNMANETLRILAWTFIAYVAIFYFIGIFLMSRKNPSTAHVPKWAAIAGGWFGLCYAVGSIFTAFTLT